MNLTEHFTLEELIRSDYATRNGINNSPPAHLFANLQMLATGLERVRAALAMPLRITSGYRCQVLNTAIGGSRTSAHMDALAADFIAPQFGDPAAVTTNLMAVRQYIGFDQLILEFNEWVHVAFAINPRLQCLKYDGKRYTPL